MIKSCKTVRTSLNSEMTTQYLVRDKNNTSTVLITYCS